MKLTVSDIEIKSRNAQIIDKIEAKFGSLENFAAAVKMSPKTVRQYLKQSKELTGQFRETLCLHVEGYDTIWKPAEQQVEDYVDMITQDIYDYREKQDIEVLDKVLNLSIESGIISCMAKSYMNNGTYYCYKGDYESSLSFFSIAKSYAEQTDDTDIIYMVITEMITAYNYMAEYRKGESLAKAFKMLYPIKKASGHTKFRYYYSLTVLYVNDRSYPYARNMINKALENVETDYQRCKLYNYLGICDKKEGYYDNALQNYRKSLELSTTDRDLAIAYNNIAGLYHIIGNCKLAMENIDRAMKYVNPCESGIYVGIYITYVEIYNTQECISTLLDVIDKSGNHTFIQHVIDALHVALDKIEDKEKFKITVFKLIKKYNKNRKLVHELYMLLGAMLFVTEGTDV